MAVPYFEEILKTKVEMEAADRFRDQGLLEVLHAAWRPIESLTTNVVAALTQTGGTGPVALVAVHASLLEVGAIAARAIEVSPPLDEDGRALSGDELEGLCAQNQSPMIDAARASGSLPVVMAPVNLLRLMASASATATIVATARTSDLDTVHEGLRTDLLTLAEVPLWIVESL